MDPQEIQEMVGKTIERVEHEGNSNSFEIWFTDGSKVEIVGRGSDERSWLEVRD